MTETQAVDNLSKNARGTSYIRPTPFCAFANEAIKRVCENILSKILDRSLEFVSGKNFWGTRQKTLGKWKNSSKSSNCIDVAVEIR